MRLLHTTLTALFLSGCACNCQPTVEQLSSTVQIARMDCEKGYVSYPGDEGNSKKLVEARIELYKAAENNAAVLLKKDPPHKLAGDEKEEGADK